MQQFNAKGVLSVQIRSEYEQKDGRTIETIVVLPCDESEADGYLVPSHPYQYVVQQWSEFEWSAQQVIADTRPRQLHKSLLMAKSEAALLIRLLSRVEFDLRHHETTRRLK